MDIVELQEIIRELLSKVDKDKITRDLLKHENNRNILIIKAKEILDPYLS